MSEKQLLLNNGEESITQTSSEIIEKKQIGQTPFTLIKQGVKGFISLGMWKITEELFDDEKEAEKYIKKNMWEIVLKVSLTSAQIVINDKNKEQ